MHKIDMTEQYWAQNMTAKPKAMVYPVIANKAYLNSPILEVNIVKMQTQYVVHYGKRRLSGTHHKHFALLTVGVRLLQAPKKTKNKY